MTSLLLDIYVDDHCRGCAAAEDLATEVSRWFPMVEVVIHRLGEGQATPPGVVAVPAFLLEGRLLQYGTPEPGQIGRAVLDALLVQQAHCEA